MKPPKDAVLKIAGEIEPMFKAPDGVRIQRQRTKGWRSPKDWWWVGSPSIWGNPFSVQRWGREMALRLYREAGSGSWNPGLFKELSDDDYNMAVLVRYRWLGRFRAATNSTPRELARRYKGRSVGCWCSLEEACHGSILLEWANEA